MNNNYPKAYKEVVEILKLVPQESVNKIPQEMLEMFKVKMDKDYNFVLNQDKSIEEQELLEETQAILANIFYDYWADESQRDIIKKKEYYETQLLEKAKREKYDVDIFAKNKKSNNTEKDNVEIKDNNSNLPIEIKQQNFFKKIINFLKKMFNLK